MKARSVCSEIRLRRLEAHSFLFLLVVIRDKVDEDDTVSFLLVQPATLTRSG